jgi:hypothetical protein
MVKREEDGESKEREKEVTEKDTIEIGKDRVGKSERSG